MVGEAWINAVATDAVRGRRWPITRPPWPAVSARPAGVDRDRASGRRLSFPGTVAISRPDLVPPGADLRVNRVGAFSDLGGADDAVTAAGVRRLGRRDFLVFADLRAALAWTRARRPRFSPWRQCGTANSLGLMLDRVNRRLMLLVAAGLMTVLPLLIPVVFGQWWLLMAVLFVWGGMVWGSYTIALAMMGDRFKTGQITLANATFIVVMEIANLAGPPIAGVAIDTADGQGLIGFFVLFSGVLFTVVALRGLRRGDLVS